MSSMDTSVNVPIKATAPMGISSTVKPRSVALRVGCWNIQDFGSGFAGWNPWPGVESEVTGHASFAACDTQWLNSTNRRALAESTDEHGRLYRYLRWRQRLYDLADHIFGINADVVVLLEMRTRGRPRAETGTLTGAYAAAMGCILGYVADMADAAGNAAEKKFREDRIEEWKKLVAASCEVEGLRSDDRRRQYDRNAFDRAEQQSRYDRGIKISAENKALLRPLCLWRTEDTNNCNNSANWGRHCAQVDRSSQGVVATADAGTAWKNISAGALQYVTVRVNEIAHQSNQPPFDAAGMSSIFRDILEAEEAARPTGSIPLSGGASGAPKGGDAKGDAMDATEDAPLLCESLLAHVKARLGALSSHGSRGASSAVTVELLDRGHKSGETVAVVYRQPWSFTFVPASGAQWMGDATYERPAYIINLRHASLGSKLPPIVLVAAHAPAPNHYADTKWYQSFGNALKGQSDQAKPSVVIAVGDFNVTMELTAGEKLFNNLLPAASVHVLEKTSYALAGSGDSKWSQPYDKILLYKHDRCPELVYGTAIRRGDWTSAEAAREFSDHSWIARDFTIQL